MFRRPQKDKTNGANWDCNEFVFRKLYPGVPYSEPMKSVGIHYSKDDHSKNRRNVCCANDFVVDPDGNVLGIPGVCKVNAVRNKTAQGNVHLFGWMTPNCKQLDVTCIVTVQNDGLVFDYEEDHILRVLEEMEQDSKDNRRPKSNKRARPSEDDDEIPLMVPPKRMPLYAEPVVWCASAPIVRCHSANDVHKLLHSGSSSEKFDSLKPGYANPVVPSTTMVFSPSLNLDSDSGSATAPSYSVQEFDSAADALNHSAPSSVPMANTAVNCSSPSIVDAAAPLGPLPSPTIAGAQQELASSSVGSLKPANPICDHQSPDIPDDTCWMFASEEGFQEMIH